MMRILVVDDDTALLNMMGVFLEDEGYKCTRAVNGSKAIKMMDKELPDVVMTDIKMPVMDGFELLERAREHWDVPFIMMTGDLSIESAIGELNDEDIYYIRKPIDLGEVKVILENIKEGI